MIQNYNEINKEEINNDYIYYYRNYNFFIYRIIYKNN